MEKPTVRKLWYSLSLSVNGKELFSIMSNPLVEQGLNLMLYGMGTVFVFLSLLVVATWAMSTVINRWFPDKPVQRALKPSSPSSLQVPEKTLRIIQDAIAQHRQR